ncbi:hypothetical protein NGM10_14855 [Halorussus salilacus]|uniref:hypothetical protein n=1 Tax=Halorussus salilacus TaxID=2953750 RepID=UPI00209D5227|nr:hypothetical protein [Halorussus salilacus]USZ67999.1 hypothetical protein NGM10_14855 [Halorussus salilacus]
MSSERPDREDFRRGMTVEIEQSNADNDRALRGEARNVFDDDSPKGAKVKLESGATGWVRRVVSEE